MSKTDLSEEMRVERAIRELTEVERSVGWERVVRICAVIAKHFFDGDLSRVGSPKQSLPVRRLAAHPLCPLSKTRLDEIFAAYQVYREEPALHDTALSPSHVAVVARCEPAERRALLGLAVEEGLGVRELKQRARAVRQRRGERRGRPPSLLAEKAQTRLENAELLVEEAVTLLARAESLDAFEGSIQKSLVRLSRLLELGGARLLVLTKSLREPDYLQTATG